MLIVYLYWPIRRGRKSCVNNSKLYQSIHIAISCTSCWAIVIQYVSYKPRLKYNDCGVAGTFEELFTQKAKNIYIETTRTMTGGEREREKKRRKAKF